ncbi:MAG: AAA family ATPase [Candidatus Pacearchaeota archaeon]
MRIKSIELYNIRSHRNTIINLPSSSILFSGDIGSGKSSVLVALEFALFGLKRGEIEGHSILRHGCNRGYVKVKFEIDGKEYTIYRELLRKKDNFMQGECFIIYDGKKESLSVEELNAKISNILNFVDQKKKNLIYKFTVYTPQEEMKRVLLEKPDIRLEIIRKLFNIDKYKRVKDNLLIYTRQLRNEIKIYSEEIKDIDSIKEEIKNLKEEIKKLEDEKLNINEEIKKLEDEKLNINNEIKNIEEKIKNIEENILKLKELEVRKNEKEKILKDIEREIKNFEFKDLSIEEVKKEKLKLIEKSNEIEVFMEKYDSEKKKFREKRDELIKKIYYNKKLIEEKIKNIEETKNLDICPKCKQKVDIEHKKKIIAKINSEIDESEKFIKENEKKLKEIEEKINEIEKEFEKKNKEAKEIEKEINRKDYLIDKIKEYKNKISKFEILKQEIEDLNKKISSLNFDEEYYKELKEKYEDMENFIDKIEEKIKFSREKLARIEERIELLGEELNEKNNELEKKEKLKNKIEKISKFENWLSEEFYEIIEKLEKIVLMKINKDFELLLKRWFSMLVDDSIEIRLAEDFTPIIEQNGYENDYMNLSGGEKTALALAYRLALNQLINSFTNVKTKGILILDEPTDGFSQSQLEKMGDLFREINAEQLIIVSHDPKIETFVDNIIKFNKENGITKINEK